MQSAAVSRNSKPACRHAAFSLLDMVVTLLIIGVLASVAMPGFARTLQAYRLDAAADRVKADLKFGMKRARTTGTAETIVFDTATSAYVFSSARSKTHPHQPYEVHMDRSPYNVQLTTAKFGTMSAVTFDGYGFPSSGGTLVLSAGNQSRIISIDGVTGHVSVEQN